jgi:hypothetical protein
VALGQQVAVVATGEEMPADEDRDEDGHPRRVVGDQLPPPPRPHRPDLALLELASGDRRRHLAAVD